MRRLGLLFWIVFKHGVASYRALRSSPSAGISADGGTNLSLRGCGGRWLKWFGLSVVFVTRRISIASHVPPGTKHTESKHQDPGGSFTTQQFRSNSRAPFRVAQEPNSHASAPLRLPMGHPLLPEGAKDPMINDQIFTSGRGHDQRSQRRGRRGQR